MPMSNPACSSSYQDQYVIKSGLNHTKGVVVSSPLSQHTLISPIRLGEKYRSVYHCCFLVGPHGIFRKMACTRRESRRAKNTARMAIGSACLAENSPAS